MAIDSVDSGPYQAPLKKAIARCLDRAPRVSSGESAAHEGSADAPEAGPQNPGRSPAASVIAPNGTLTLRPLRAVAFLRETPDWAATFPLCDVAVEVRCRSELCVSLGMNGEVQVILIDLDGLNAAERSAMQSLARISGYACAGLTDATTYQELAALAADLDAVGPASNTPDGIGWLVRTAYVQAFEKQRYRRQLLELQETMRRKELISRAKSIIAEQGRISEADALRQLRSESRKQRRAMWELSQLIVDAYSIMCPRGDALRDEGASIASRLHAAEFEESDCL
jgi:hypothetical protein